ncbi:hypothetical protein [Vulcanisaeta thermophila]|uniref:hypothetical protein n=1 Tax=Vulcanisaeta thermophila TaxID=867917 RepID=UPI000853462C|nr:hypothetical protein [Vulcanisaeta thermophila]
MVLKELLITQAILYGVAYAFLAYLRVSDLGIYVSIMALIYIVTMLIYSPLPRRLRLVNDVLITALVLAFLYFAITRIIAILGFP